MGKGKLAVVHASDRIPWHDRYAEAFRAGLGRIGIKVEVTRERQRVSDAPAICLGTTLWRQIEADDGPHLLVDRCSFGDPDDVVTLTWNGKGMRGNPVAPKKPDPTRWLGFNVELKATLPRFDGEIVLCGQTESFSPDYDTIDDWYNEWERYCTHFRPHPAESGARPVTLMPASGDWRKVSVALVLNSSVAIDALRAGVPDVLVMDAGSLAYRWNRRFSDRYEFLIWLAWTQWRIEEIEDGKTIEHLFRKATARRVRS